MPNGVLELGDGLAELLAFHGVLDGLVESSLGYSKGLRGDTYAASVEGLHGYSEAPSHLAEQIGLGYTAVGEDKLGGGGAPDTELQLLLAYLETRGAFLYDKGGNTLVLQGFVSHCKYHVDMGMAGICDEDLVAVQYPLVPVEDCGGLLCRGVCTRIWFGQTESSEPFAGSQSGQILALLLLGAVLEYRCKTEGGMCGKHDSCRGAYPRKFLHCDGVHDVVPACPAVFNGEGYAEESERSHLLDRLYGESLLFVDLSCSSISAARGFTSFSANSRIICLKSDCVGVSLKFIFYNALN